MKTIFKDNKVLSCVGNGIVTETGKRNEAIIANNTVIGPLAEIAWKKKD